MESVVSIIGTKVKGRILVNRSELCKVLGISPRTLTNRICLHPDLKDAKVETVSGEMFDLERALSIKVLPKQSA